MTKASGRQHAEKVLAHQQQAQAAAIAPQGRKLAGNIGPGMLRPGAGKQVQRSQQPLLCGTMTGRAFDATDHANSRDANRTSTRFAGEIMAIGHDGQIARGMEWYLPPTVARAVKAALRVNQGHPVPFSIEVWCEPDAEGRPASPLGYSYVSYDRVPTRDNDPLMLLAYEAGILDRPQAALPAPEASLREGEELDPETGEIRQTAPAA
jgi:hypothetical protein